MKKLKAPFPYFGGKSRVAAEVWRRFGDVKNYVEPFCGSCAVLLQRPTEPRVETVNDTDGMISNFWRALKYAPDDVVEHADWPALENDLHARHAWLIGQKDSLQSRLEGDPDYYDAKIAGWWCWGISCWIGTGFCEGRGPWSVRLINGEKHLLKNKKTVGVPGLTRSIMHLAHGGKGIHGISAHASLRDDFNRLAARLRQVRVTCGDWSRVCKRSVTYENGLTGVFLDPPYSAAAERHKDIYNVDSESVARAAKAWAVEQGNNKLMRIALCGYDGEHDMPNDWACFAWRGYHGYAAKNKDNKNRWKERIWFSPACLNYDYDLLVEEK